MDKPKSVIRKWQEVFSNDRFGLKIQGKHPILAVFHNNKQPLYVWQHIRVVCYLQFEGSIFVSSSSVMSGNGFERISFIHSYGSMSASLQHAMKV